MATKSTSRQVTLSHVRRNREPGMSIHEVNKCLWCSARRFSALRCRSRSSASTDLPKISSVSNFCM